MTVFNFLLNHFNSTLIFAGIFIMLGLMIETLM